MNHHTDPTNEKAPGAINTEGLSTTTNDLNFATGKRRSKALLKAHLAQAGYLVRDVADGYLVVRADWGLSRHCDSLADLQAFAKKVGVSQ